MAEQRNRTTITRLREMKARGEKITFLTAYDYPTALLEDRAGIDMILVGDSAAMCMLGHDSTLPITMDEMITFARAVRRGAPDAFVVGDLPFLSYQVSDEDAVRSAGRFMAEARTDGVKLEGGERATERVRAITRAGIPVMGHIGLTPQSQSQLGGFRAQGRDAEAAFALVRDAEAIQEAGAFALLIEAVPAPVAALVTERLHIPVLSLGAGPDCDGQLLIAHDLLGLFEAFTPRFVERYAEVSKVMLDAFSRYREDVRSGAFPTAEHTYGIDDAQVELLRRALGAESPCRPARLAAGG
jgi:3-methyl-2-oxobutanoate hydroxymethyltransferase